MAEWHTPRTPPVGGARREGGREGGRWEGGGSCVAFTSHTACWEGRVVMRGCGYTMPESREGGEAVVREGRVNGLGEGFKDCLHQEFTDSLA